MTNDTCTTTTAQQQPTTTTTTTPPKHAIYTIPRMTDPQWTLIEGYIIGWRAGCNEKDQE